MRFELPPDAPRWTFNAFNSVSRALDGSTGRPWRLQACTVANLPDPTAWPQGLIVVTDEVGGEVPAWSDGTDWRRMTDRAVVS